MPADRASPDLLATIRNRVLSLGNLTVACSQKSQMKLMKIVEEAMRQDETTASQLHVILTRQGISLSLSMILRCRRQLAGRFVEALIIREAKKIKRLEWARKNLANDFADVVFTNKCSIHGNSSQVQQQEEWPQKYCLRQLN